MSLLKKTLLVVVSTVIVSTVCLYFASQLTLLQGYEKIEQNDTRANVLRVVNSDLRSIARPQHLGSSVCRLG